MLPCKEVSRLIASDELREAGFGKRLAVRLHLLMCIHCSRFASQIRRIGMTSRQVADADRIDDADFDKRLLDRILPPPQK
jgi:hypothetical protein